MVNKFTLNRGPTKKYMWDFDDDKEEGREKIHDWSKNRQKKLKGLRKWYHSFSVYTFNLGTLYSFTQNFNYMVFIQMAIAGITTYLFQHFDIAFDVHVSLFVSPIVFPLAFSINTDFQRREKVLEDLANFKSAGMLWYFCMREWKQAAELDDAWMNAVHSKLKSMLFHLREYLLTDKLDRRKIILRAMYEDFSDTNQLIEKVRASKLPANTSIVSRVIHLLNMMSLSFERLRVVREYRSPRSIRSFNKVLILFLPVILGPYFVEQAKKSNNSWSAYYIAILVSFVFSALQGVQDKLDDPFDGMSEDDIDLEQIDEWTFHSLEATVNRTFKIGRFQVNVNKTEVIKARALSIKQTSLEQTDSVVLRKKSTVAQLFERHSIRRKSTLKRGSSIRQGSTEHFEPGNHPFANVLEKIDGNTKITRSGLVHDDSSSSLNNTTPDTQSKRTEFENDPNKKISIPDERPPMNLQSLFQDKKQKKAVTKDTRGVSFSDNPVVIDITNLPLTDIQPTIDTPLLEENKNVKGSRFKLMNIGGRITSSTSSPTPSKIEELDELNETDDTDESESGFVVINENSSQEVNKHLSKKEDDVFV